jgi:spermidine synthase
VVPRAAPSLAVAVAVFISGAALLGVEIAASRVLAPFFGNSLFVWGSLIGVVLGGLALGYGLGGALADRYPTVQLLVALIGLGAALVLAIPLLDAPVLEAVVRWDAGPRLNPLLASLVLFGPMSIVLAGVTPVAVRLQARSLHRIGRTAGHLFAISTAGSIAGTIGTAFWLVPELGTGQLLGFAAFALFAAAAITALADLKLPAAGAAAVAAAAAAAVAFTLAPDTGDTLSGVAARNWSPLYRAYDAAGPADAPVQGRIVYSRDTRYHRLYVVDDGNTRYLRFDASLQSAMYREDPYRTRFRYTDYLHLGVAYKPDAREILFVGLGGGSAPKRIWRDFPHVRVRVAEIDPVVVDVAERYFALPRDRRLTVAVADGRGYLDRTDGKFDVIVLDAFFADGIPFHLFTHEFLELARQRLAPGGVVVTNVIGTLAGPGSRLFRSIYRTYRAAFPTVLVHPVEFGADAGATTLRNLIVVATEQPAPEKEFLVERWEDVRERFRSAPDLREPILDRHDAVIATRDVPVLTDEYAPTDSLLLLNQ